MKLVGQQFGNYRLIHHIARGGFADVYLGEHRYLKTHAAIKIIDTHMSQNDVQAFFKEAQMIATLKHPHIVRLLDFGVERNIPFLVMEYAKQGTLRQRHPKGRGLPITTILSYVEQVASALQYAHECRLIHRDVKPDNLLMERNGEVLLSDFGITIIAHNTSPQVRLQPSGTPLYMAPEQWNGHPHPASDQYAFAVVVYEWLSGKTPFQGDVHALSYQHKAVPPPPFSSGLNVSPAIENVICKALSKDPNQRFPNIKAFATALERASWS